MSNSQFCIQQRQKEQQQLKKLLVLGFASSTLIHSILAYALPRWSFESSQVIEKPIEITIVDKIKPKPQIKPKPKVESKQIVEPKTISAQPPEPVKTQTPTPIVKPQEPVPKVPVPKATPKKVLTAPAPSQPKIPAPVEKTAQPPSPNSNFTTPSSSSVTSSESSKSPTKATGSAVATNSMPLRPETVSESVGEIVCINNCEPEYPTALAGVEGSAGVKLSIDRDGNVIGAELTTISTSSKVNRQALLAARQMQFSSPGDSAASVRVKIDFTVEGSEYDHARREEQGKREQAKNERQEQEAAQQHQLEAEQQARQEQLEREQARQQQFQQQQQSTSPPVTEAEPVSKPLPALSPEKLDEERLRKFQERMENYQEE